MNAETISALFSRPVSVCVAPWENYANGLYPDEEALVLTAFGKRRHEFSAGRRAARAALTRLGAPQSPILRGKGRDPLWPPGFVGSITHCDRFSYAAVARRSELLSLGIDVEVGGPLESATVPIVCRPEELAHFAELPKVRLVDWPKLAFSAKEAFHKCHFPLVQEVLDFLDASVHFKVAADGRSGDFAIRVVASDHRRTLPLNETKGGWIVSAERVCTVASVSAGA